MLNWVGEDISPNRDKTILRTVIKSGTGYEKPKDGSNVEVHIEGTFNGQVIESRDVNFVLGEGEVENVIEGIEAALLEFNKGEVSKLNIKSQYAFGTQGKPDANIPPNAEVEYVVELKNFEKGLESWSMDENEKIKQAKNCKEKGTNYFKQNKLQLAIKMYKKIDELLSYKEDFKDQNAEERESLMLSMHLNLALCYLKTGENTEAKNSCDKALEISPKNEKALFRRGQANLNLASPEIAIKDFQAVVTIEPKNTAAVKQIAICNDVIKKDLAKEKKLYANMFEKFAKQDRQV